MKRLLLTALLCACFAGSSAATAAPAAKPNIVVFLSDDFGWGSSGCYGAPADVKTPQIDRLAHEGRRFTNAYAPGSVCSPTRYGLMTGRYYWRTSIKDGEVLSGSAPLLIETDRLTLASLCKQQGYRTAAFGKWHLGMGTEPRRTDWSGELKPGPLEVGFDYFFGLGSNPWSGPHYYIENHEVLGKIPDRPVTVNGDKAGATTSGLKEQWKEHEIMQTLTQKAVGWIEKQEPGKPFFLYFATNAVHRPVAPNPNFKGSKYGAYGDFIHELDWSVGEVLGALDRQKLADNTLIIFTSDNGGVINEGGNDEIAQARKRGLHVNGELRGGKHDIWEGGFREPFLVRWPGKVPAGTTSDQVICLTDLLATFAGIFQAPLPSRAAEDSFDVGRAFTEEQTGAPVREQVLLQSADPLYAVRAGDWKLVERVDAPAVEPRKGKKGDDKENREKKGAKRDELFNLKDDPSETKNVIAANADRAEQLKQLLRTGRDQGYTRPGAGK